MIEIEIKRESYQDVVTVTLDENGVEGLCHAAAILPGNPSIRSLDVETGDGGTLRLRYESVATREEREKKEAEDRVRYDAEREARDRELAGAMPKPTANAVSE